MQRLAGNERCRTCSGELGLTLSAPPTENRTYCVKVVQSKDHHVVSMTSDYGANASEPSLKTARQYPRTTDWVRVKVRGQIQIQVRVKLPDAPTSYASRLVYRCDDTMSRDRLLYLENVGFSYMLFLHRVVICTTSTMGSIKRGECEGGKEYSSTAGLVLDM
jgi:hypothetical protein